MKITRIFMEPFDKAKHGVLRKFDNTKLVALNTCPTWGIVRYEHHRTYLSGSRAMALEAGTAAHEAFAACRLADLYFNGHLFYNKDMKDAAIKRATKLFGDERTASFTDTLQGGEDSERATMLATLDIFGTSGFYEDPNDRKRTIGNIEEALIAYVSRYPLGKTMAVVIDDWVGIEIPVNMYLEIVTDEEVTRLGAVARLDESDNKWYKIYKFNFTGRIDGIHYTSRDLSTISIEDNKTASRLSDAWRAGFIMSHQPTGYMVAASSILKRPITDGMIRGMCIPLPKAYDYGGIINEPITRSDQSIIEWAHWIVHTASITAPYLDDPCNAPKYTHSCDRYFRPCPLIPFCDNSIEERELMLEDMAIEEWSPLEDGDD